MMPPSPFSDLLKRVRRENNWLSRNYHGNEWFDGEANLKYFALQLREITRQARCIATTGLAPGSPNPVRARPQL